jgi:hypothetical protein
MEFMVNDLSSQYKPELGSLNPPVTGSINFAKSVPLSSFTIVPPAVPDETGAPALPELISVSLRDL